MSEIHQNAFFKNIKILEGAFLNPWSSEGCHYGDVHVCLGNPHMEPFLYPAGQPLNHVLHAELSINKL